MATHQYSSFSSQIAPRLGRTGPRIDPSSYEAGDGADKMYDITPFDVYKDTSLASAVRFGPGLGRPHSPRQTQLAMPGDGAAVQYDAVPFRVYKASTGFTGALSWEGGDRFKAPRKEMADVFYDLPDPSKYRDDAAAMVPRLGPGPGRKVGPRIDPTPYRPGDGADRHYSLPNVAVYKEPDIGCCFSKEKVREQGAPIAVVSARKPPWVARVAALHGNVMRQKDPWRRDMSTVSDRRIQKAHSSPQL